LPATAQGCCRACIAACLRRGCRCLSPVAAAPGVAALNASLHAPLAPPALLCCSSARLLLRGDVCATASGSAACVEAAATPGGSPVWSARAVSDDRGAVRGEGDLHCATNCGGGGGVRGCAACSATYSTHKQSTAVCVGPLAAAGMTPRPCRADNSL
jgi:hypothetical protein